MPLKTDSVEEPTLNLTPMIDVVFLLIIFFMVGSRFTETEAERQYDVNLPTVSDARPLTSLPDEIVVNVAADGRVFVGERLRTLDELRADLVEARRNFEDQAVIIRGDAAGPYQHVMDVMAVCHAAEIRSVSLANRLKPKEDR